MPGRWEQLWVRKLSVEEFEICCIPFFTYGVALGDTILAGRQGSLEWVLQRVLRKSGHRHVRVAVTNRASSTELHEALHGVAASLPFAHEWRGPGFLAIDIPPGDDSGRVTAAFQSHVLAGNIELEVDQ
jgi:hypothetical protein